MNKYEIMIMDLMITGTQTRIKQNSANLDTQARIYQMPSRHNLTSILSYANR